MTPVCQLSHSFESTPQILYPFFLGSFFLYLDSLFFILCCKRVFLWKLFAPTFHLSRLETPHVREIETSFFSLFVILQIESPTHSFFSNLFVHRFPPLTYLFYSCLQNRILKDNRRLGVIHDRAFSGLHHLRTL